MILNCQYRIHPNTSQYKWRDVTHTVSPNNPLFLKTRPQKANNTATNNGIFRWGHVFCPNNSPCTLFFAFNEINIYRPHYISSFFIYSPPLWFQLSVIFVFIYRVNIHKKITFSFAQKNGNSNTLFLISYCMASLGYISLVASHLVK